MEDSTIMMTIVLILFFVMMNKKCGFMENFADCEKCRSENNKNVADNTEESCCYARCEYDGKTDDLSKKIIEMRCDGVSKSLKSFGI